MTAGRKVSVVGTRGPKSPVCRRPFCDAACAMALACSATAPSKPVAMTMMRISSCMSASSTEPTMMFASSWARSMILEAASSSSAMVRS